MMSCDPPDDTTPFDSAGRLSGRAAALGELTVRLAGQSDSSQ